MMYPQGRFLPSMAKLSALITVARTGSMTRAAEELCLTQSAVSRQVKELEEFVGRTLIERRQSKLELTSEGKSYIAVVAPLLNQIEEATLALKSSRENAGHITVSSQTTFAMKLLLPKLLDFQKRYPDIVVNLVTHLGQPNLQQKNHADALILFREQEEAGWCTDKLLPGVSYAVCSPQLLQTSEAKGYACLSDLTLLHQRSSPDDWREYLDYFQIPSSYLRPGPVYSLLTLGLQAALSHQGIAILPSYLIEDDLQAGRLVKLMDRPFIKKSAYMLLIQESKRGIDVLEKFRSWILEQFSFADASAAIDARTPPNAPLD